jgi:hypothetical protein
LEAAFIKPAIPPARPKMVCLKPSQVVNKKRVMYQFDGEFAEVFGSPERHAKWFITGPSFSGKSNFVFKLCAYLCRFGMVWMNNFEEGDAATVAQKLERFELTQFDSHFRLYPRAPIPDFKAALLRKRSGNIAVVDSIQHAHMNKRLYDDFSMALSNPRRGKMLLFISHYSKNDFTSHVRHDCDIKIEVIGFVARVESRYGQQKQMLLIWEEGAKKYWGKHYKKVLEGKFWTGIWKK